MSALTFLAAFLAGRGLHVPLSEVLAGRYLRASSRGSYQPKYTHVNGEQLVMVYFGSAHCAWANRKEAPQLIERIQHALERQAQRRGWSFEAVGVALDWDTEEGLDHLRWLGRFDEVSSGYSWANMIATRYFDEREAEPASTPEIMVVRRTLRRPNQLDGAVNYTVTREHLLTRKSGLVELQRWAQTGALLPARPDPAR